jgi:hypothetical protein
VLSPLGAALCLTGFLAGLTGAWSPCGFSVVDTLRSRGRADGRSMYAAAVAFACGAVGGGVLLFGSLAVAGAAFQASSRAATVVALSFAAVAAAGEALGLRIVPQIRRQVPEPWRRTLPLPLAAGLYGVLLGLGFTTFVLTLALPALAAISVALAEPQLGIAIGIAFGAGRAVPVFVLASAPEQGPRARVFELMAERPSLLLGFRRADAAALAVCVALLGAEAAHAVTQVASPASDPSAAAGDLAWQQPGVGGFLRRSTGTVQLPGQDPAVGGQYVAWHIGDHVTVASRETLAPVLEENIKAVQKLAVSDRWLVFRQGRPDGGALLGAHPLPGPTAGRYFASVRWPAQLGRPSIDGDVVVFHVANRIESALVSVNLKTGARRVLRRSPQVQLLNPAVFGSEVLYVRVSRCSQELRLAVLGARRERVLLRRSPAVRRDVGHEEGHTTQGSEPTQCPRNAPRGTGPVLWTTALASDAAYLTVLERSGPSVISVGR